MLGVLVIDKPQGLTSHDVVDRVRRALGTRRVGHAGSLDPLATGALVVAVGPATRFLQYLPLEPKTYLAQFMFGIETNTQDSDGEVIREEQVPSDLAKSLEDELPSFLGGIEQMPPMFSAVKKDGKPLYEYARKGEEVVRKLRQIFIHSIQVVDITPPRVSFEINCSGGTYIRTLGHDLGAAIGCGAHMTALRRTKVGKFGLDNCISLDQVSADDLMSLEDALHPMPFLQLTPEELKVVEHGNFIDRAEAPDASVVGLLDLDGKLISAARVEGNRLQPECVIPKETSDAEV